MKKKTSLSAIKEIVNDFSVLRNVSLLAIKYVILEMNQSGHHIYLDRSFFNACINTVAGRRLQLRTLERYEYEVNLIRDKFMPLVMHVLPSKDEKKDRALRQPLDNLSKEIETMYKNNMAHISKDIMGFAKSIDVTMDWKALWNSDRNTPYVFMSNDEALCMFPELDLYDEKRQKKYATCNLHYFRRYHPLGLLWKRLYMNERAALSGRKVTNVCPLGKTFQRCSMRVDTRTLIYMLANENTPLEYGFKSLKAMVDGIQDEGRRKFWSEHFRLDAKIFEDFAFVLTTDGIKMSVLKASDTVCDSAVSFLDEMNVEDARTKYAHMTCVGVDPNKRDILFCVAQSSEIKPLSRLTKAMKEDECLYVEKDGGRKRQKVKHKITKQASASKKSSFTTFRYTMVQRRREGGVVRFNDLMRRAKAVSSAVSECEERLSSQCSKTCDPSTFLSYVRCVGEVFLTLWGFNANFDGLRWWKEQRQRSSEDRMCQNMRRKFGEDFYLALGNWGQRRQAKWQPPSMTKGVRKILHRNAIPVVLIDEYRTSKKCYGCQEGITAPFTSHLKKPAKDQEGRMSFRETKRGRKVNKQMGSCHGKVKCKSCSTIWNRDFNSALNIRCAALSFLSGAGRPRYLQPDDGKHMQQPRYRFAQV